MHAAGSAAEAGCDLVLPETVESWIDAGADIVLLPAPGTVPGANPSGIRDLVAVVAQEGARPEALGLTALDEPVQRVLKDLENNLAKSTGDVTVKDLLPAEEARTA